MKCLVCGKEYIALGVHIRHKHKMLLSDYKEEFGLMNTTPLADDELRDALRASQKQRLLNPEYLDEVRQLCAANAAKPSNLKGSMSKAGREAVAKRDAERNELYLAERTPDVLAAFQKHGTILPVAQELNMGSATVKRILAKAGQVTDRKVTNARRVADVVKTVSIRREPKLAALIAALETSTTAVQARAAAGVSKTTYTRWRRAGLLPESSK